ncbi:MAG: non-canonical purine NTP pyrophosphatase [Peptococcaceae bacterium]|nr:non-canonical purine NTP pyrophosphatase [Peptococcaceae bacterium]
MRIVLATTNPGKVGELEDLLKDAGLTGVEILSLADFPGLPVVEETGKTFAQNALLKARGAWLGTGLPALADDSGLEIDALRGEPGVRSARFAGEAHDDEANITKVLSLMAGVPTDQRGARFQCALALVGARGLASVARGAQSQSRGMESDTRRSESPEPVLVMGRVEGVIATEKKGDRGFGYDPIFYLPERNLTMAQLLPQEKNTISHRGQAFKKMLPILCAYAGQLSSSSRSPSPESLESLPIINED